MKRNTSITLLVGLTSLGAAAFWLNGKPATAAAPTAAAPAPKAPPPVEPAASPAALAARARHERVKLGEHLVLTSGCHDCHTPFTLGKNGPEPDMTRALSGHPETLRVPPAPAPKGPWQVSVTGTNTGWSGPWGVSFTANLTPDKETGLGEWTEDDFVQTIRTGRHLGRGRPILPPMPIPVYQNFSDAELRAIFAYLRTLPAVKNRVPTPLPPAKRG